MRFLMISVISTQAVQSIAALIVGICDPRMYGIKYRPGRCSSELVCLKEDRLPKV